MDVEKTMQFLLEQQARFDARQAQSDERVAVIQNLLAEVATAQARTSAILDTLIERHLELAQSHKELSEKMAQSHKGLAQSHKELSEEMAQSHKELAQSQKELSETQKITERNLNTLIAAVERHIADHN